ncbi:hypothetical protein JOM56_014765 [Amanita muscaria]
MRSSTPHATPLQPLQTPQINNQNNNGINGHGSHNSLNCGNNIQFNNITQVATTDGEDAELDGLLYGYVSEDALHTFSRSPPKCHPNTRTTIRNEIGEWIDDSESEKSPLLWLNGPAGVGKSVIAKTLAASHDQLVVSTFFFSTSSDRTATTLFPTLARQLARRVPETKRHIIDSLKNNRSLLTSEFEVQLDHLIVQPLTKCTMRSTSLPVMVVDGLDECTDENKLLEFLRVLVCGGESGNMPLRFIICSRPEPRIRRAILQRFRDEQQSIIPSSLQRSSAGWRLQLLLNIKTHLYAPMIWVFRNPTLLLQEVWKLYRPVQVGVDEDASSPKGLPDTLDTIYHHSVVSTIQIGSSKECEEDIAQYLTDEFNAIRQPGEASSPWFRSSDVLDLVKRSCGQFLYASTIVRLLDYHHPMDVLDMARNSSLPTPDLNELYKQILKRAHDEIRQQEGCPDHDTERGVLKDTLAILIVFAENVHFFNVRENFAVIEGLLGLKKDRLTTKLRKMHSVLSIVPGKSISVYHRSFFEFLQSQKRSGEHCISYRSALRRFLVLLGRMGLWRRQPQADGDEIRGHVKSMALAYRRNYFQRFRSPMTLIALHDWIHCSLPFLFLVPFRQFTRQFKESLIGAPTSFILQYLFLAFFSFFILSSGSFIISLTLYTLLCNHFILPLFHPFLHPYFVIMVRILLSPRLLSIVMFQFIIATLSAAFCYN